MFKFAITNSRGGTKMPVIKSERQLEFLLPYNQDIVKKFQSLFSLSEVISSSVEENYRLKILKNWLLPMFMNGQVDFVGTEN